MAHHVEMRALTGGAGTKPRRVDTEWLAKYLRFNFYLNRLASGDRLPSVRELARTLHISPNTVLELYKDLENTGVVETRPRSGTFLRRIGSEDHRPGRDTTLFKMVARVAGRLELLGVSPEGFADLLLRYTGSDPRPTFSFAVLSSAERFQILERQLGNRLKWRLPVTVISPDATCFPSAREQIAADSSIRCLISSYLYCDLAFRLAAEFHLQVIVERLDTRTADVFEPPESGTRYIVTRDAEFAANIRHLMRSAYGPEGESRISVTSLEDAALPERLEDALEVFASPFAFDAAAAMFGATKRIKPLTVEISEETIEDLLFHYVFDRKVRAGAHSK